jgi:hypothetical protein
MDINTQRSFFSKIAAIAALLPGFNVFAQQTPTAYLPGN